MFRADKYRIQMLSAEDSTSFQRPSNLYPQSRPMAAPRNSAVAHLRRISQGVPLDPQQVLTAAFTAIDYQDCIKNLPKWRIDPQAYIDGLDQVDSRLSVLVNHPLTPVLRQILDTLSSNSDIYKRCLRALRKACGIYGLLPVSHLLPPGLTTVSKRAFASGGFGDVWKARSRDNHLFAVKRIRIYEVDNLEDVTKVLRLRTRRLSRFLTASPPQKYCKEVVICRRMRHSNVLSVEGVAPDLFELCMVSKWMAHGNMSTYLRDKENVDRMKLVSSPALS